MSSPSAFFQQSLSRKESVNDNKNEIILNKDLSLSNKKSIMIEIEISDTDQTPK